MSMRLGLTGGAACGKSSAARCFETLGVPVIDADDIVRDLTAPGQSLLAQVLERAGARFQHEDGSLNRAALRLQIFQDNDLRHDLESLLHPPVKTVLRDWFRQRNEAVSIAVVPLLLEAHWHNEVDRVLVINCPAHVQQERLQQRDGMTPDLAQAMLSCQLSEAERVGQADDVLHNTGNLDDLADKVARLHAQYLAL